MKSFQDCVIECSFFIFLFVRALSFLLQVERMFEEIREAFIESVPKLDWMDHKTKSQAIAKAKAMKVVIGFPEWILNWDELDAFHNTVSKS